MKVTLLLYCPAGALLQANFLHLPIPALDLITRLVEDRSYGDIMIPKIDLGDDDNEALDPTSIALDIQYDRKFRHHTFTIIVAIVCFLIGTLVGSFRKGPTRRYQRIPDVPCAVQ